MIERKLKPDGSVREYQCEAVHRSADLLVVRFVVAEPSAYVTPIPLERGTISDGWFWRRRPYSLYRFHRPRGGVAAHRFDAVDRVEFDEDVVTYRDLVLDWWVLAGGEIVEEDRDELEELRAAGTLAASFYEGALRAAQTVLGRYRHILDEVETLERRLGITPEAGG
jgi:predicted RNA-binding protein associated with RNAse of E/G family